MKKVTVLMLICLFFNVLKAQITLSYKVIDCKTGVPVPYVHIGIAEKSFGTTSNEEGFFTLNVPEKFMRDTLTISFVGYETKRLPISTIKSDFKLCPSDIQLKEVTIKPKKEKILGRTKEGGNSMIAWFGNHKGYEIARLIDNNKTVLIKKIGLYVEENAYDTMKVLVTFYRANGNKVGEIINTKPFFWNALGKKKGWLNYDLPTQIEIEGDFFVGLEIVKSVGSKNEKGGLILPGNYNLRKMFYVREASQDKWESQPFLICLKVIVEVE
jgi:CarboxypepD_reg-like domain